MGAASQTQSSGLRRELLAGTHGSASELKEAPGTRDLGAAWEATCAVCPTCQALPGRATPSPSVRPSCTPDRPARSWPLPPQPSLRLADTPSTALVRGAPNRRGCRHRVGRAAHLRWGALPACALTYPAPKRSPRPPRGGDGDRVSSPRALSSYGNRLPRDGCASDSRFPQLVLGAGAGAGVGGDGTERSRWGGPERS